MIKKEEHHKQGKTAREHPKLEEFETIKKDMITS